MGIYGSKCFESRTKVTQFPSTDTDVWDNQNKIRWKIKTKFNQKRDKRITKNCYFWISRTYKCSTPLARPMQQIPALSLLDSQCHTPKQ